MPLPLSVALGVGVGGSGYHWDWSGTALKLYTPRRSDLSSLRRSWAVRKPGSKVLRFGGSMFWAKVPVFPPMMYDSSNTDRLACLLGSVRRLKVCITS